jgi:LacI family transcriptional regulator
VGDEQSGRQGAEHLLGERRPRALVCGNDEITLGAIRAAERLGLRVPADLA